MTYLVTYLVSKWQQESVRKSSLRLLSDSTKYCSQRGALHTTEMMDEFVKPTKAHINWPFGAYGFVRAPSANTEQTLFPTWQQSSCELTTHTTSKGNALDDVYSRKTRSSENATNRAQLNLPPCLLGCFAVE
eukprot:SAG11_NODE_1216_length_5501_cov_2.800629_4_plen_132_part_00